MISQIVKEIQQEEFKFWFLSQKKGAKEKSDEKQEQQGVKTKGCALKDLRGRETVLKSSLNSTRTRQRWQVGGLRVAPRNHFVQPFSRFYHLSQRLFKQQGILLHFLKNPDFQFGIFRRSGSIRLHSHVATTIHLSRARSCILQFTRPHHSLWFIPVLFTHINPVSPCRHCDS